MNPWGRCRRPGPSKAGITSLTTDKRKGHLRLRTANRGGSQPARLEPLANVYHLGEDLLTNLGPVWDRHRAASRGVAPLSRFGSTATGRAGGQHLATEPGFAPVRSSLPRSSARSVSLLKAMRARSWVWRGRAEASRQGRARYRIGLCATGQGLG